MARLLKVGGTLIPRERRRACGQRPSDLARLAIEVQNEYAGTSEKILSKDMARQMLTRQKDNRGLGFALENPGRKLRFSHTGSNEGYRCELEAYTVSGQGIVNDKL